MPYLVPESALTFGFLNEPVGTHTSRTIMLAELRLLLAACPSSASMHDYRAVVLEQNVLLKKTASTRKESFRRLRELYGLGESVALFRAMRDLWNEDAAAQPLLALFCASARDPLLRGTADSVLDTPVGNSITPHLFSDAISKIFPARYSPIILGNLGRHIASSWRQSGHLIGRARKTRSAAKATPASLAYALLLGHLCGARGEGLFQTLWSRLLDTPTHSLYELASVASQRGYLEYRHSGNVIEVSFRYLLRDSRTDKSQ